MIGRVLAGLVAVLLWPSLAAAQILFALNYTNTTEVSGVPQYNFGFTRSDTNFAATHVPTGSATGGPAVQFNVQNGYKGTGNNEQYWGWYDMVLASEPTVGSTIYLRTKVLWSGNWTGVGDTGGKWAVIGGGVGSSGDRLILNFTTASDQDEANYGLPAGTFDSGTWGEVEVGKGITAECNDVFQTNGTTWVDVQTRFVMGAAGTGSIALWLNNNTLASPDCIVTGLTWTGNISRQLELGFWQWAPTGDLGWRIGALEIASSFDASWHAGGAVVAPTVTSVSPTSGPTTGGTLITITGTNFAATPTITVGGLPCTSPHLTSSTQVECTTPARSAGVVSIVVTNPNTESGTGTNLYTYSGAEVTTTLLQTAEDETDQATGDYSFAAQSLGVAAVDRMITVVSLSRKSASGSCATPTVTIAGVAATSIVTSVNGAFTCNIAAIHKALVPTGTTGTITINYPAAMLHAHITVYRTTGPYAVVASESGSSIADDPTGSLNIAAGGYAIGGSLTSSAGTSASWTGLTEAFDALFSGSTANRGTGAMLIPATVQTDLPITVDWTSAGASVGVWAAWQPYVAATSPTHYVTSAGNASSDCTVGDPCTLTRAFALAGTTTIPPGSWVSVAAGIYNQAAITTTGGGVSGAPIRFVGAGTSYATGSRITGTRTSFPGASWSLCAASTYSYCATFDEAVNYTVALVTQRPSTLLTTWVDITVDDRQAASGWTPSGRAFTLDEPINYTQRTSAASVEAQHCTFYHNTTTNTLYIHPCREAAPTNGDQYYAGPDGWGTITYTGAGDYLSLENVSIEHTTNYGILTDDSVTGTTLDDLRMLSSPLWNKGRNTTATDLVIKEVMAQGPPHAQCYSLQYGGEGLASRSCWNAFAVGYNLVLGVEDTGYVYNHNFDRITLERGWNGVTMEGYGTLNHALVWGFGNHAMQTSGSGVTVRNSIALNSQDGMLETVESWANHTYEHNLFYNMAKWTCGNDGVQGGATCPTSWTVRYNIFTSSITDYMVEPTVLRDCNVWMPRNADGDWLRVWQVGGSTVDYDTLAQIQAGTISDDNSISYPHTSWTNGSIFSTFTHQQTSPVDFSLAAGGATALTTCGVRAGPDTLTTGGAEPTTAVRVRFRTP